MVLQPYRHDVAQGSKESDEVTLASTVGADEHGQIAWLERVQSSNALETLD
jgi:hypothetical protein